MPTEITNEQLFAAATKLKNASTIKEELEVERHRILTRLQEIEDLLSCGDYDFEVQHELAKMMIERNMKVLVMDNCVFMLHGGHSIIVADGLYMLQSNKEKEDGTE